MKTFDVIVIGAGNGGLASAASLATLGKSVCLFEKHNIPGGCGTSFRRGRFEFEVALHQLSSLGSAEKPGDLRKLFRRYGIEDEIQWIEIKELFRVNFPDGTGVSLPADREACIQHLSRLFPAEADAIRRYFDLIDGFYVQAATLAELQAQAGPSTPSAFKKFLFKRLFPRLFPLLATYGLQSAQEVLDAFFQDDKLKKALSAYWCFMGVPPERFPFAILAKCTKFYMDDKPYYLEGTSMMMNQAILEAAKRKGAEVHLNCGVARILLEDGVAVGVIDDEGREYRAKRIISNISPLHTYGALLRPEEVPAAAQSYLRPYTVGISAITCFIGLDCPPDAIGFNTSFTLNYQSDDLDFHSLLPGDDPMVATCYTVDDPRVSPPGTSLITAGVLKYSEAWEKLPPEQYYEMKNEAGRRILDRLEALYPGLREHVETFEVATPLTHMRYLNHPGGAIYGYEQDLYQSVFFFPQESQIPHLVFASGWVNACGFGPNYLYADRIAQQIAKEI